MAKVINVNLSDVDEQALSMITLDDAQWVLDLVTSQVGALKSQIEQKYVDFHIANATAVSFTDRDDAVAKAFAEGVVQVEV